MLPSPYTSQWKRSYFSRSHCATLLLNYYHVRRQQLRLNNHPRRKAALMPFRISGGAELHVLGESRGVLKEM